MADNEKLCSILAAIYSDLASQAAADSQILNEVASIREALFELVPGFREVFERRQVANWDRTEKVREIAQVGYSHIIGRLRDGKLNPD